MIDINKLKLTDMGNPELIPQLVEEMNTKFIKEEEKIICEKLFDLDIDKDILINQTQEINRLNDILREYKELEEQGLLLKLPCKIGDTVYQIPSKVNYDLNVLHGYDANNRVYHQKVSKIVLDGEYWYLECDKDREYGTGRICLDIFFGETWFLTKEEAEQALKEMEGAE